MIGARIEAPDPRECLRDHLRAHSAAARTGGRPRTRALLKGSRAPRQDQQDPFSPSDDAIDAAKGVLEPLGAQNFVVEDLDESVASLFTQDSEPETEPEPTAVSSESPT